MTVLLFNKQIVADKNLDNIYELVENGTWTMEAMAGMMAKAYSDVDGDTVMTDTDVWGAAVAGAQWSQSFFPVSDKTIIAKDNEDIPYLNASSDRKLLEIIEYQWNTLEKSDYFMKIDGDNAGGTTSSYWDGMVYTTAINMFSQEKALFTSGAPMYLVSDYLRNMQSHFGIVPYPTFDEVKPGTGYGAFMPVLITHVVPYNTSAEAILGEHPDIEEVRTWEMDSFDIAWQEWLGTAHEFALGDLAHFDSLIKPYTCFVGMMVKKR